MCILHGLWPLRILKWWYTHKEGAPYSQLFFIRFEANPSEYGSYSLHICMFRYIHKHHLFASFASYSLQTVCTDSHTNILFDAKKTCCSVYLLQSEHSRTILSYWRIFASLYSFRSEYSQNFQRISHSSEYSLTNICIPANIRHVLLQII
jgi:hypothetical protein